MCLQPLNLCLAPSKGLTAPWGGDSGSWGAMDAAGCRWISPHSVSTMPPLCPKPLYSHARTLAQQDFIPKMPGHGKEPGWLTAPTTAEPPSVVEAQRSNLSAIHASLKELNKHQNKKFAPLTMAGSGHACSAVPVSQGTPHRQPGVARSTRVCPWL